MYKSISLLFACTALFAAPASAANFAGPRLELRGGWDKTTLNGTFDDGVDRISAHGSKSGFNIGAEVGYDALISPTIIAGAYAGIEGATTKRCFSVIGNDQGCLKLGRNFTAGARLGSKVGSKGMFYVKGGYSNGQLRATYHNADDPTLDFSDHTNRGGYHLGLGGELAVGQHGYVRAEYVHTNYNGQNYTSPDFRLSVDAHRDQLLLGFGVQM